MTPEETGLFDNPLEQFILGLLLLLIVLIVRKWLRFHWKKHLKEEENKLGTRILDFTQKLISLLNKIRENINYKCPNCADEPNLTQTGNIFIKCKMCNKSQKS